MTRITETFLAHGFNPQQEMNTMVKDQAERLMPLLNALVQGKTLQITNRHDNGAWIDLHVTDISTLMDPSAQIRVKPEPKYREWKIHEIPVGAIARRKKRSAYDGISIPQVILGTDLVNFRNEDEACYAVMHFEHDDNHVATQPKTLLTHWEWKWAHEPETAWRPCGAVDA